MYVICYFSFIILILIKRFQVIVEIKKLKKQENVLYISAEEIMENIH